MVVVARRTLDNFLSKKEKHHTGSPSINLRLNFEFGQITHTCFIAKKVIIHNE